MLVIDNGDSCHIDDLADGTTQLKNVYRLFHAEQDGANGFGSADFHQQLVGNVSSGKVGEYQRIGPAFNQGAKWIGLPLQCGVKRYVCLNVTLHDQTGMVL